MLHPSYTDLMNAVNAEVKEGEKPIVNSRYSIVIAAARRARQIIGGAESTVDGYEKIKPLSVAVEEIYSGKVKILKGGADTDDDDEKLKDMSADAINLALDVDDEEIFEDEADEVISDDDEADEASEEAEKESEEDEVSDTDEEEDFD